MYTNVKWHRRLCRKSKGNYNAYAHEWLIVNRNIGQMPGKEYQWFLAQCCCWRVHYVGIAEKLKKAIYTIYIYTVYMAVYTYVAKKTPKLLVYHVEL